MWTPENVGRDKRGRYYAFPGLNCGITIKVTAESAADVARWANLIDAAEDLLDVLCLYADSDVVMQGSTKRANMHNARRITAQTIIARAKGERA